ncbi:MAG: ATP-dependent zinc metalloprotease FtsH [Acidobacteria bacterium]|nr:ATP-dependent zinc metalloprotease FtsH [Acidobacteriota bacterium]
MIWLFVFAALVTLLITIKGTSSTTAEVGFNDVFRFGEQNLIKELKISAESVEGVFHEPQMIDGTKVEKFKSEYIFYEGFIPQVLKWNTPFKVDNNTSAKVILSMLGWVLPIGLIVVLWVFFLRQMQAGGNKAMMFGKSRAKLLNASQKKITFKDVAGCDEAKEELHEIIEFLKEPQKFQRLGGKIPKGVLLMGPPGTGKTLLARATAGEANVPFFSISGSDFVEMFVGVGASRVRDLFDQGKKQAPCIIFIDEIDAVGRHRGAGMGGGHDEREQTLNQLLVEMDGFESNDGVILIAATNRPDVLDPAIMRPGRFDRRVVVDLPDVKGRQEILAVHTRKVPVAPDVNLSIIARGTPGFSGADLANMVNEAALYGARRGKRMVSREDFEDAKDKVMMGAERRSLILSEEEKWATAVHESGHALVAAMVGNADPVHKVTIIPRGRALGVTMQLPLDDRHSYSARYLESRLAILMGGRVAEDIVLSQTTSGASNDIEVATKIARQMVCEMGMSRQIGPISLRHPNEMPFIGRDFYRSQNISEKTAELIDTEVRRLVDEAERRASEIITQHRAILQRMSEKLMEIETLEEWHIDQIVRGEELTPHRPGTLEPEKPQVEVKEKEKKEKPISGILPDSSTPLAQT